MNIPPGLADQVKDEYRTTGTITDETAEELAGAVKDHLLAEQPHLRAVGAGSFDWTAFLKTVLPIIIQILGGLVPKQPGT